jgi:hypothetical protein
MAACAGAWAAGASAAQAHGVGERYDLPVPLAYYVAGAGLVVLLTFAVAAAFPAGAFRAAGGAGRSWRLPAAIPAAAGWLAIGLLALVVAAGVAGDPHPGRNFAPTFLWIVWWCGYSLVAALAVDLWPAANPWRAAFDLARAGRRPAAAYPGRWGAWPAVAQLLLFAWFETVSPWAADPRAIAAAALAYTLVAWAGMARYGADAWLERGDPFALVFRILGRFAPFYLVRPATGGWRLGLRWPGAGLLEAGGPPPDASTVAFVMAMLATVLFDGFLGTALWRSWDRLVSSFLPRGADREGYIAATLGLLGIWLAFLLAYRATAWLMRFAAGDRPAAPGLAGAFCLTLVPIAIGYNLAHNFTYVVVQGQSILALASDPFGRGWDLFGTASFKPDIATVAAGTTWSVAVGAIVLGHVAGVVLAHVVALRVFGGRGRAIRALVPMTILMVLYTMASLTILAEPITRFRAPDPGYSGRAPPALAAAVAPPTTGC